LVSAESDLGCASFAVSPGHPTRFTAEDPFRAASELGRPGFVYASVRFSDAGQELTGDGLTFTGREGHCCSTCLQAA
jgi:hypothetical protein